MSVELTKKVDELGTLWKNEFLPIVERAEQEQKKHGERLAETKETLEKLNDRMDEIEVQFKSIKHEEVKSKETGFEVKYEKAFNKYFRSNDDSELKQLRSDVSADGGYLSPENYETASILKAYETSPVIEAGARVFTFSTGDSINVTIEDGEIGNGGWVGEITNRDETDNQTYKNIRIETFEQYTNVPVSLQLMQDAKYNIEQETIALGTAKMMRVANLAFVKGNGANKPKGFTLDLPTGVDNRLLSNSTTAFDADDLIRLHDFALKSEYARVGKFAMNRKTKGYTREFKAGDDNYLWIPGIAGSTPATLLGKEYVEFDDMDAPTYSGGNLVFADGKIPVIFADWNKFYGVARKSGIYMLRDPYTKKHSVLFYMSMRVGGARLLDEAGAYLVTTTS